MEWASFFKYLPECFNKDSSNYYSGIKLLLKATSLFHQALSFPVCANSFSEVHTSTVTRLVGLQHCHLSTCAHQITALQQQNPNKAKFSFQRYHDCYRSNAEKASYFYENILFWKAQEQWDLWPAICHLQQIALLQRLCFPKAVVRVGSRLDFVRTNLFPQPFFIFFVDARFPVREQGLRWKWMFFQKC